MKTIIILFVTITCFQPICESIDFCRAFIDNGSKIDYSFQFVYNKPKQRINNFSQICGLSEWDRCENMLFVIGNNYWIITHKEGEDHLTYQFWSNQSSVSDLFGSHYSLGLSLETYNDSQKFIYGFITKDLLQIDWKTLNDFETILDLNKTIIKTTKITKQMTLNFALNLKYEEFKASVFKPSVLISFDSTIINKTNKQNIFGLIIQRIHLYNSYIRDFQFIEFNKTSFVYQNITNEIFDEIENIPQFKITYQTTKRTLREYLELSRFGLIIGMFGPFLAKGIQGTNSSYLILYSDNNNVIFYCLVLNDYKFYNEICRVGKKVLIDCNIQLNTQQMTYQTPSNDYIKRDKKLLILLIVVIIIISIIIISIVVLCIVRKLYLGPKFVPEKDMSSSEMSSKFTKDESTVQTIDSMSGLQVKQTERKSSENKSIH